MKNQKSDPKKVSSKKKLDIDESKKATRLKPSDKKINKNWKNSLFTENEDDFNEDELFNEELRYREDDIEEEYND
ncbi:MAG: hypothetical protein M3Q58_03790 [Bacteroidota bacterium]|nr:hypothetical protein [Bacteroidota bacterium]